MILIVGANADPHVSAVALALQGYSYPYEVLDIQNPGLSSGVQLNIASNASLAIDGKPVDIEKINAVWWRQKPRPIVPAGNASDLYDYYFSSREWSQISDYLTFYLKDRININQKESARVASNKPLQIQLANEVGFLTPKTLISNSSIEVESFLKSSAKNKAIFKTLSAYMNPTGYITYTTIIEAGTVTQHARSLENGPGIFQEFIDKEFELRITVVGSDVFSAKINSNFSEDCAIDWRQCIFENIYEKFEIDSNFREKLLCLHRRLGLVYGAYDFIVNKDGIPVFLEVNPAGQWMWIENRLGYPISRAIARLLAH